jgi:exodeoxyribonuclease-5
MLTHDQESAFAAIHKWLTESGTSFLLDGGAGTGKTFVVAEVLRCFPGVAVACAPTHKATRVLTRKLKDAGVQVAADLEEEGVVTGTTARLLGYTPAIKEDQDAQSVGFTRGGRGLLTQVRPDLLVVDEVSMLSAPDFRGIFLDAQQRGYKVLAVGDAAQLPPVQQKPLRFEAFSRRSTLCQIVRQEEGSAILELASAVRQGRPWRDVVGEGVEHRDPLDAFLREDWDPALDEHDRPVFIAYRNARIREAQEAACQRWLGHGAGEFRAGERAVSQSNLYREGSDGRPQLALANQEDVVITRVERKGTWGPVVRLLTSDRAIYTELLMQEQAANPADPWNVELRALRGMAEERQALYASYFKNGKPFAARAVDKDRRLAWRKYFDHRDQTVATLAHPFAITSHKSQGSTYRAVYADATDLGRFSRQALYVAVTRPRERLVLG